MRLYVRKFRHHFFDDFLLNELQCFYVCRRYQKISTIRRNLCQRWPHCGLCAGAEHLRQINLSDLSETIDHMNSYDVKTILDLISLLSLELELRSNIHLNMRVPLSSLNYRLTRLTRARLTARLTARPTNRTSTAAPSGPCDSMFQEKTLPLFIFVCFQGSNS